VGQGFTVTSLPETSANARTLENQKCHQASFAASLAVSSILLSLLLLSLLLLFPLLLSLLLLSLLLLLSPCLLSPSCSPHSYMKGEESRTQLRNPTHLFSVLLWIGT
jgi:hypothetical protein